MLLRFIDNCVKNKIFESQNNLGVVIAVSGGADSLALMDLLQFNGSVAKISTAI